MDFDLGDIIRFKEYFVYIESDWQLTYNHYLIIEKMYRGYLTINLETGNVVELAHGEINTGEKVA